MITKGGASLLFYYFFLRNPNSSYICIAKPRENGLVKKAHFRFIPFGETWTILL